MGIETYMYGVGSVIPPVDLWIGLDTYMNYALIYNLHLEVWLMRCATCIYFYWDV